MIDSNGKLNGFPFIWAPSGVFALCDLGSDFLWLSLFRKLFVSMSLPAALLGVCKFCCDYRFPKFSKNDRSSSFVGVSISCALTDSLFANIFL
jgi:hypothetical protein